MSASSWGIGAKGLQRVSQHGSLGLDIVTDGHETSPAAAPTQLALTVPLVDTYFS
jgi:hypothetical protein